MHIILRSRWRRRWPVQHLAPVIVHVRRRGRAHLLLTRVRERVREAVRRWRPEHGRPHVGTGGRRRDSEVGRRGMLLLGLLWRKSRVLRVPSYGSIGSEVRISFPYIISKKL